MLDADFDPAKLAHPASGFRFPPKISFSQDQATVELRLVISGWLKLADQIVSSNAGVQELRDAVGRVNELVIAVSARQLALQQEQEKQRQAKARDIIHGDIKRKPRKTNGKPAPMKAETA